MSLVFQVDDQENGLRKIASTFPELKPFSSTIYRALSSYDTEDAAKVLHRIFGTVKTLDGIAVTEVRIKEKSGYITGWDLYFFALKGRLGVVCRPSLLGYDSCNVTARPNSVGVAVADDVRSHGRSVLIIYG
jgi:hypothetical protein